MDERSKAAVGSASSTGRVVAVALQRRSYRGPFVPQVPAPDIVDAVLAAGSAAPSSKNARPWRFHVVDDPQVLVELASAVRSADGIEDYVPADPLTGLPHERYTSTVVESADTLAAAPLAIFIENRGEFSVGRETLLAAPADHLRQALMGHGLEMLGIGGAVVSMWLAASDLGLAGVFMGDVLIAEDQISSRLGLEGDLIGVLVLGWPASEERSRPGPVPGGEDIDHR